MVDQSERVILNQWNGRPTEILVSDFEENHGLYWLIVGRFEDVDLWLEIPLTGTEIDSLVTDLPMDYSVWLDSLPSRKTYVRIDGLGTTDVLELSIGQGEQPLIRGLREMIRAQLNLDPEIKDIIINAL